MTYIPRSNIWGEIGENFGGGLAGGIEKAREDREVRDTLANLPKDAGPREVLNAVMNSRIGSERKKEMLSQFMQTQQLEQQAATQMETGRHHRAEETIRAGEVLAKGMKQQAKTEKEEKEKEANRKILPALVRQLDPERFPQELKDALVEEGDLKKVESILKLQQEEDKITREVAERSFKTFYEEPFKKLAESARLGEEKFIRLAPVIDSLEKYTKAQQFWDAIVDMSGEGLDFWKSKEGQTIETARPNMIAEFGKYMSGVLSQGKIKEIGKKTISVGRNKDVSRLLLYIDIFNTKMDILRDRYAKFIMGNSKYGLPGPDFQQKLDAMLLPHKKMIAEDIERMLKGEKPQTEMAKSYTDMYGEKENFVKEKSSEPEPRTRLENGKTYILMENADKKKQWVLESAVNSDKYKGWKKSL